MQRAGIAGIVKIVAAFLLNICAHHTEHFGSKYCPPYQSISPTMYRITCFLLPYACVGSILHLLHEDDTCNVDHGNIGRQKVAYFSFLQPLFVVIIFSSISFVQCILHTCAIAFHVSDLLHQSLLFKLFSKLFLKTQELPSMLLIVSRNILQRIFSHNLLISLCIFLCMRFLYINLYFTTLLQKYLRNTHIFTKSIFQALIN